jgi:hypothetical protein
MPFTSYSLVVKSGFTSWSASLCSCAFPTRSICEKPNEKGCLRSACSPADNAPVALLKKESIRQLLAGSCRLTVLVMTGS